MTTKAANSVTIRRLTALLLILGLCVGSGPLAPAANAAPAETPPAAAGDEQPVNLHHVQSGSGDEGIKEADLLTTANKADWMADEIKEFNQEKEGSERVVLLPTLASRLAMEQIIGKKVQPVLWSPGSRVWVDRLAEVWKQQNNETLLDPDDTDQYKTFLRSPIVFLTTKEKAKYLRQVLSGRDDAWRNIRLLSLGKKKTPWGTFNFAYSDPTISSTGMYTVGLILKDYAQHTNQADLGRVANGSAFGNYLQEMHRGHYVYDDNVKKGTNALCNAYADNPALYDFITCYESLALTEVGKNPDLAVVYPNPTVMSEQSVAILGGHKTVAQMQVARDFMGFLASKKALESGVNYNFRPFVIRNDVSSLETVLNKHAESGFQDSVSSEELPAYEALNASIFQWRHYVHAGAAP